MNTFIKGVLPVVAAALAFPAASLAQSSDAAYCKARPESEVGQNAAGSRCQGRRREVQDG
jgi:hypothetical protein